MVEACCNILHSNLLTEYKIRDTFTSLFFDRKNKGRLAQRESATLTR